MGRQFWPVGAGRAAWEELDGWVRGRILEALMPLRHRLRERTLRNYLEGLSRLAVLAGGLERVEVCERVVLALPRWIQDAAMAAYRHYCRYHGLREPRYQRPRRRRRLPRLPPMETLKAAVGAVWRHHWRCYFRLLLETGARASEALELKVRDLDLKGCKIRLGTGKGSGYVDARELPISPHLAGMLRELVKDKKPGDWVFSRPSDPSRHLEYRDAERVMRMVRNRLRASGYDVEGLRLHAFRHAYGSRLYAETHDLLFVARALGHRDLETTKLYIHLQPQTPQRYEVRHLSVDEADEIARLLAEGWQVALQAEGRVWLKRPRWWI